MPALSSRVEQDLQFGKGSCHTYKDPSLAYKNLHVHYTSSWKENRQKMHSGKKRPEAHCTHQAESQQEPHLKAAIAS